MAAVAGKSEPGQPADGERPAAPAVAGPDAPPLVIVTGASGGIGAAIAARLARPGITVGLVGRDAEGLERASFAVKQRGGKALTSRIDVTTAAFSTWVEDLAARHALLGFYASAGVSAGPPSRSSLETAPDTDRLVDVNLSATIANVRAVVVTMRRQGTGRKPLRRISIVSSIAGLFPTPDLAVYSATKAGLIAYAHALRPRLKRDGISLTVCCPGFVTTPMSARHKGAKPFEMRPEAAARRIVAATEAGRRTAVFPLPFALMAYLAPIAPGVLIDAVVPLFRAEIAPDPRAEPPRRRRKSASAAAMPENSASGSAEKTDA
jgi:short-subunit dehydrogenase